MKKFIKFCLVGVCNTALTFAVFYILSEVLRVNYLLGSFLGYIAGVINSFILNKLWTFQNRDKAIGMQFTRFAVVNAISLGINLFIMYICVERLHIAKMAAQIIATGFSTVTNYLGSRVLVFNTNNSSLSAEDGELEAIAEFQKIK
jgi:putative flippase GtrA